MQATVLQLAAQKYGTPVSFDIFCLFVFCCCCFLSSTGPKRSENKNHFWMFKRKYLTMFALGQTLTTGAAGFLFLNVMSEKRETWQNHDNCSSDTPHTLQRRLLALH